jgi:hypothetical protein
VQVPATQRSTANGACFAVCKCDYDLDGVAWEAEESEIADILTPGVPLVYRKNPMCEAGTSM